MSWSTDVDGGIIEDANANGIGEGELQTLHHAWEASRMLQEVSVGGMGVEITAIDNERWIAAFLVHAVYPSDHNVHVMI